MAGPNHLVQGEQKLTSAYKGADNFDRRMSWKVGELERCMEAESLQVLSSPRGQSFLRYCLLGQEADLPRSHELMRGIQHLRTDIPEHRQALEELIKRYTTSAPKMAKVMDFSGPIFTIIQIHGWHKITLDLQLSVVSNPVELLVDPVANYVFSALSLSCHPHLEKLMDNFLCKGKTLEAVRSRNEYALMALGWCVKFRAEWMSRTCPDLLQEIAMENEQKTGCASQRSAPRPLSTAFAAKGGKRGPKRPQH